MNTRRAKLRRIAAYTFIVIAGVVIWRISGGRASDDVEAAVDDLQRHAAQVTTELLGVQPHSGGYGISMFVPGDPEDDKDKGSWAAAPTPTPEHVVILVHGLDEPGQVFDTVAPALDEAGYDVARFDYPNDQSPAVSAELMDESLRALFESGTTRVDIVAHSMGGLISRDVMTREGMYAGVGTGHDELPDVGRLILVGTPNQGSPWARLRAIGEIREQVVRFRNAEGYDPRKLLTFLTDGLGDAGEDLLPGSDYLTELNARPLAEGIEHTTIIGEIATAEGPELEWVRENAILKTILGKEQFASLLDSIDELLNELGDGVVTARSARLDGVDDAPMVTGSHRGMLLFLPGEQQAREALTGIEATDPPGIAIILERLGRDSPDN